MVWFLGIFSHTVEFCSCSVVSDFLWLQELHAAHQASLSVTNSWSLLKLMSVESVMHSNCLILFSCLQSFPASGSFPMSWLFAKGLEPSASASVLPVNIQGWFPFGLAGLITLLFKGLSRVFSSTFMCTQKNAGWCFRPLCPWLSKFGSNQGVPQ